MSGGALRPKMGAGKSAHVKTSLRVARHIVRDIVEQQLPPGTRLPGESLLMESYNVSRSSMREALRILETNGFVTVRPGPGGGPVVNDVGPVDFGKTTALFLQMTRSTLAEVLAARQHIESLVVRVAADHHNAQRLEALRASLERHEAYDEHDVDTYLDMVFEFHLVLADAADNAVLGLFSLALQSIVTERVAPSRIPSNRWREVIDEHIAIARAILERQPELAQSLMESHMSGFCETYRRRYPNLVDEVIGGD